MSEVPLVEIWNGPLRNASGRPLHRVPIPVAAVIPDNPYLRDGKGSVVDRAVFDTDTNGVWVGRVVPCSQFERTDAYYIADEREAGGGFVMFRVPDSGPIRVRDYLITQPPVGSGPSHADFVVWFSGSGPPPDVIVGAKPGDMYVDDDIDNVYQLR